MRRPVADGPGRAGEGEDRELAARVLAGDAAAFRELVRRHQRLVAHLVFRMVRDPADREELCQDVFFRVYRKLHGFRGEARLSTWIARVAYRTCLNHLERKGLADDGTEPAEELPCEGESPVETLAAEELRAFVRERVAALPLPYRTVVTLHHLEEMSVREISEVTGAPPGTVKSHLFRARALLREQVLARYAFEELRS